MRAATESPVEGTPARPRARRRPRASGRHETGRDERGIGLVEIVFGLAILSIVFLPALGLVANSVTTAGTQRSLAVARSLAVGQLNQEKAMAAVTFPPSNAPNNSSGAAWPAYATSTSVSSAVHQVTYTGLGTFDVYVAGGWCTAGATPGSAWGTGTISHSTAVAYFVATKVTWGQGAGTASSATNSVVMSTSVPGTTGAPGSGSATGCPTGLS